MRELNACFDIFLAGGIRATRNVEQDVLAHEERWEDIFANNKLLAILHHLRRIRNLQTPNAIKAKAV